MPTGIDETYEDAMKRIRTQSEDDANLATKVLSYVFLAKRPLNVEELIHISVVEPGDTALDESAFSEIEILLSVTAGLVTIDTKSGTVRLVHYTLQEYLAKSHERLFPNAEVEMVKACLTYLSFNEFENGPCTDRDSLESRLKTFRFFDYTSRNWGHHVIENQQPKLVDLVLKYMRDDSKLRCSMRVMLRRPGSRYPPWQRSIWTERIDSQFNPLHAAA